jgi:ABC-2 type transport system permease protein
MEEKTTKVVELVLSSIRSRDLLIGKIVGVGVVSMAQVLVLVGATLAAAAVFGASVLPAFDLATVVWGLLWFVLGYLFWGSAYAAAASLTNGPEDSQSIMPVSVLMVLSYMIGVFGSVDPSSAGRVASWLPPIAPFAMPSRIVGGEVPIWEAVAVYGLAAVTTAGVVRLAERIYVRSILHLDRRVGWGEALFMERT